MPPRKAAQKKPARKESKKKLKMPSNKTSQMKEKTPRKAPQRNLEGPSSKLENNTKAVVLRSPKILDSNSKYVARRRPMLCMICKKNFRSKKMLDDHYAKHHFFRHCPNCPKTFQSTRAYILHLRSHLADYPYECKICLIGFNKKADLILHKKKGHITNDEYGCDKCANVFPTVFCRNRHRMTHRPPPYGCDCGASFSNIPDKLVHRKNHVHRCILCPKEVVAFPSNYDLLKHIYEVHPPKKSNDENNGVDLVEPCISNGVVRLEDDGESDSMDDLLSSSDDESPSDVDSNYDFDAVRPVYDLKRKNRFICFICYNLYPSSELLKTHMKAHKWYPCNSCPKFFANAEALEKHECRVAEVPELECHVVEVPKLEYRVAEVPSCKICNTECQKCKKNVDPGVNIPENGLSTPEFPGVPELPIFNYYDINVRNWVCNLIQYVKSVKGPIDFQSVAHMFAHTTNLQVILEYPPLRQLFPNECILEIEELYSQCLDLSYTLWNRMNR